METVFEKEGWKGPYAHMGLSCGNLSAEKIVGRNHLSVVHLRLPVLKMSSKHFVRGLFVVYGACNLILHAEAR